jgi:hypothetical protein
MLQKEVLLLSLFQCICFAAAQIAAKVFHLTLPQPLLQRAHEATQSQSEGILRRAVVHGRTLSRPP